MFQFEMADLMSGVSPELLLLGHEEEIENQVSEILLQDFNDFQKFALNQQQQEQVEEDDGFNKKALIDDVMLTTDMFYPSARPSDITGQSLAVTMETDKTKVLNSMSIPTNHTSMLTEDHVGNTKMPELPIHWLEPATIDIAAPSKAVQATETIGVEETQEVIEEIQDFLDQFADEGMDQNDEIRSLADELLSEGQKANLEAMDVTACPLANSTLSDEDFTAAEDLLDNLIHGNFTSEEIKQLEESVDTGYSSSTQPSINVSNVSEIITEDGQNIIIVIAPSSSHHDDQNMVMAPTTPNGSNQVLASLNVPVSDTPYQPSELSDDESNTSGEDSDWLPDVDSTNVQYESKANAAAATSPKNKPGRRLQERTASTTSVVSNGRINKIKTIKDRKERKKMQNVEAARRYRDKKKEEESKVDTEEKQLTRKNLALKETLNGIEGELNTIKKLMTELGLIKLVTPKTSRHVK